MDTLRKIVSNQYFPAGAVLAVVLLFWSVGLLGGLSLLHNNQPPLTTLTWLLFVYGAAVLTPLAGILAAVDLVRRWRRNLFDGATRREVRDFAGVLRAVRYDAVVDTQGLLKSAIIARDTGALNASAGIPK